MNISNAIFTNNGCLVTIDGWQADLGTKLSLLMDGVCNVRSLDPADAGKADDLADTPCGQDGSVYGCQDRRLVELAARHRLWLDAGGGADMAAEILDAQAATSALLEHLATLNSDN